MAITPLPTPPSRDDPEATFVSRADAFLGALPAFGTEANDLQSEVDTKAAEAATSASNALDSENAAAASEIVAAGAANYQGIYDSGVVYAIGESVTYAGFQYIKNTTTAAGVTPVDGADWTLVRAPIQDKQVFTSSGTWVKPVGATWCSIECISGGGGGRNETGTTIAGGGSGGESVSRIMLASELAATETVTVGAGGLGSASGSASNGSNGGNTSFGAHFTAVGGNGGSSTNGGTLPRSQNIAGQPPDNFVLAQAGHGARGGVPGGNTIYGGAGGGSTTTAGGTSELGGDGGGGSDSAGIKGGNGVAPGGGGGGSSNDGGGGDGGDGQVTVISW